MIVSCAPFPQCEVPGKGYVRHLYACCCFGSKELPVIFGISRSHIFLQCGYFPHHPVPTTYGSLFSVNSSLSLYNPCNNPEERASKTLFFLTLIPTDPTLLWFFALLHEISANRSPRSQELALQMYLGWGGEYLLLTTRTHASMHKCNFPGQAVLLSWTVGLAPIPTHVHKLSCCNGQWV